MWLSKMKAFSGFVLAALLTVPAFGASQKPVPPGTLNYVEGKASLGSKTLGPGSVGKTVLASGQSITTGDKGYAEILLTPGVFVRVGNQSTLKMVSPGLANTAVQLDRGRAMVEVDQISPENNVRVTVGSVEVRLDKRGLYGFDADRGQVQVFKKAQATAFAGNRHVEIKGDHQFMLGELKTIKFDEKSFYSDDLYRFSSLRSEYAARANSDRRRMVVAGYYPGWWGWYWNPYFGCYTFYPGVGYLYSPFGWGFYPYGWFGWGGYYGGFYGRGFYRGGFRGRGFGGVGFRNSAIGARGFSSGGARGGFSGGHSGGGHR